jgi:hypothetical protein
MNPAFAGMKSQAEALQVVPASEKNFPQRILVISKYDEIIHIADIELLAEFLLHPMIKPVEVNIGKKLARQITYRNSVLPVKWREQIVARKVNSSVMQKRTNDLRGQPQSPFAGYPPSDPGHQDSVVDARKISDDVALEDVATLSGKGLIAVHRGMGSLSFSTGIGIKDKSLLEDGFNDVAKGVVNHAVPERCRANQPFLGVMYGELGVGPRPVGLLQKLALQTDEFGLQVKQEPGRGLF